jgi:hypothetical protein
MRQIALPLVALLWIAEFSNLHAAEPRFRPALIGNGPNALINRIDAKKLIEKGQGDGLLFFTCYMGASGVVGNYLIYREIPGAELLKKEVGTHSGRVVSFRPFTMERAPTLSFPGRWFFEWPMADRTCVFI